MSNQLAARQRIDLGARRQARLEAKGEPRIFEFDDHEFIGPQELPLVFVDTLAEGRLAAAVRILFGERGDEFLRVVNPTVEDLVEISNAYGASLPSSLASTRS